MTGTKNFYPENKRQAFLGTFVLALAYTAYCWFTFGGSVSVDLMPIWIAAKLWSAGQLELIFANDTTVFTMAAPAEWAGLVATEGFPGMETFPFIYPPIWAVLLAPVTELISYSQFDMAVSILNPMCLTFTPWVLWRAAPVLPPAIQIGAGFAFLAFTTVGLLPIMGNQVQIMVALLLALTIERSRNNAPVTAGMILAFAAALKLYPAVFAVLFIAARQNKALMSFLVSGTTLALASLFMAGWPLHAQLLSQLNAISATIMQINLSANLDALVVLFTNLERLEIASNRGLIQKPEIWMLISKVLIVGLFVTLVVLGRKRSELANHPLFWPFGILCMSLLGPLSWTFHYITPLAAAPILLAYWPRLGMSLFLALVGLSVSILTIAVPFPTFRHAPPLQFWATIGFLALAVVYALTLARRNQPGP